MEWHLGLSLRHPELQPLAHRVAALCARGLLLEAAHALPQQRLRQPQVLQLRRQHLQRPQDGCRGCMVGAEAQDG